MKYVDGYGTKYIVTEEGKIFHNNGSMREIGKGNSGKYRKATLTDSNGFRKQYKVHRLVANAFIEREKGKTHVDHIDGNRLNNSVSNLRWCTDEENQEHRIVQNNHGGEYGIVGNVNTPVKIMHNGIKYHSKSHLARELSKIRGATEGTLRKRIREVIARKGTLYGFPIQIL